MVEKIVESKKTGVLPGNNRDKLQRLNKAVSDYGPGRIFIMEVTVGTGPADKSKTATVPENGVKAGKDLNSKNAFTAIPPLFTPEGFVNPAAIRPNSHSC